MKRKFTKALIALFACACIIAPAQAKIMSTYPDVAPNHWAAKQIKELSQAGVIVGYPDGTFKPDENVTRAEFASMAIKALGQEHTTVVQPVNFTDITKEYWAYDFIQKALYFELISCPNQGEPFRPEDNVSYAEAASVAVNALTTEQISLQKAKEVLSRNYSNVGAVPEWFLIAAGKAEILNMNVHNPSTPKTLKSTMPATRAEIVVLLKNMIEEAKLNPNRKLAEAMRKKTGEGLIIRNAFIQGSIGTIPAGSIVPIQVEKSLDTQITQIGEVYLAKAPQNYITRDKYILISKGADLRGQIAQVKPGKLFLSNGVLVLSNDALTTVNDQMVPFKGIGEVCKYKGWFMTLIRKIFKGEKLYVPAKGCVYVKLTEPIKIDLTNGWVLEEEY